MTSQAPISSADSVPNRLVPYIVLVVAQLAVGSAAILARFGLSDGVGPFALAAWRLVLASCVLLAIVGIRSRGGGDTPRVSPRDAALLLVCGVLLGLHFVTWFASLQRIPIARSTLLVTTSPVFTGLIAIIFLKQRIPSRFWWGLLIAAVGLFAVTLKGRHPIQSTGGPMWTGDLLALAGAMAIAVYLLIAQQLQPRIGSARLVTWTYSCAALTLLPAALLLDSGSLLPFGISGWGTILGMALVPQIIGHTALNWSLKHFSAGAVGSATLLEPVFAATLAWWLFKESITPIQGIGALILLTGVFIAITARAPEHLNT